MVERYAESLKNIGVFTERQLSRMSDAALLSDIIFTFADGIKHASETNLDKFYERNIGNFPEVDDMRDRLTNAMDFVLACTDIHKSSLMKSYNFYTLLLAISHALRPAQILDPIYARQNPLKIDLQYALPNLTSLAYAIDEPASSPQFAAYVEACSKATTRLEPRKTRFIWLSKALEPVLLD